MQAEPGEVTAVIGPNAAGKTTLLKCIAGILKPEGSILLNGREISRLKKEEIVKYVSYLPQENSARAVLTVFETVLLGRIHSLSWRLSDDDLKIVLETLETFGISELASRFLNELSTGQRQIISIAQSIVRQPKILLLDEPTSSLDLRHQLEILDLVRNLTVNMKVITLIALHDLNLAARYADKIIVLNCGKIYATGKPESVLTEEMIRSVYRINVRVSVNDGILQITPISSIMSRHMSIVQKFGT